MLDKDNKFRIIFRFAIDGIIAEQSVDIGKIQNITNNYTISKQSAGMPTQPAQNTFVMDTGVTRTYTFEFLRILPDNPVDTLGTVSDGEYTEADSKKWSNGFWIYILKRFLVNRWQMETDGCQIQYLSLSVAPNEDESEFYPTLARTNAYINKFTPSQSVGNVQSLSGTISFTIGATNINKTIAKHTVIFEANYANYSTSSEATNDHTNMIKIADEYEKNGAGSIDEF